jgi:Holliday junction resolvasome RuvABC DNA-binding subunit
LLPNGDFIKLFTHLQIKEDAHTLFGFIEKSEREIFKMLLSVSGIGASIARTMLSSLDPNKSQMQLHQQMLSRYSQLKELEVKLLKGDT